MHAAAILRLPPQFNDLRGRKTHAMSILMLLFNSKQRTMGLVQNRCRKIQTAHYEPSQKEDLSENQKMFFFYILIFQTDEYINYKYIKKIESVNV